MADGGQLQGALGGQPFGVRLDREAGSPAHRFTLRLFHPREPIALADILPPAEHLGLRVLSEVPFLLHAPGPEAIALQGLTVETMDKSAADLAAAGPRFIETCDKLWPGPLARDGLHPLVLRARLAF